MTLVELMIVLVVVTVLVTIALPQILGARISANESAAVQTLRLVVQAQTQFASSQAADLDLNGVGEYGTFGELSGGVPVRAAAGGTNLVDPSLVSRSFEGVGALGELARSGYRFRLYLPDAAGRGLSELPGGGADPAVDAARAEGSWCVYAWPQSYGTTGRRTFFVNQDGSVVATEDARYSGPGAPIPPGAALRPGPPESAIEGGLALREPARDGNLWRNLGD